MSVEVAPAPTPHERSGFVLRIGSVRGSVHDARAAHAARMRNCWLAASALIGGFGALLLMLAGILAVLPWCGLSRLIVSLVGGTVS